MKSLEFDATAFEDLAWWIEQDRDKALRIIKLIKEVQRDPFRGIGKPEPLRHELVGCWSRRIDREHRLVSIKLCRRKYAFSRVGIIIDSVCKYRKST